MPCEVPRQGLGFTDHQHRHVMQMLMALRISLGRQNPGQALSSWRQTPVPPAYGVEVWGCACVELQCRMR